MFYFFPHFIKTFPRNFTKRPNIVESPRDNSGFIYFILDQLKIVFSFSVVKRSSKKILKSKRKVQTSPVLKKLPQDEVIHCYKVLTLWTHSIMLDLWIVCHTNPFELAIATNTIDY